MRIVQNSDLNAGIGDPWAGQSSDSDSPEPIVNLDVSDFWENLGLVLPIGSGITTTLWHICQSQLCNSAGKKGPCDG